MSKNGYRRCGLLYDAEGQPKPLVRLSFDGVNGEEVLYDIHTATVVQAIRVVRRIHAAKRPGVVAWHVLLSAHLEEV